MWEEKGGWEEPKPHLSNLPLTLLSATAMGCAGKITDLHRAARGSSLEVRTHSELYTVLYITDSPSQRLSLRVIYCTVHNRLTFTKVLSESNILYS